MPISTLERKILNSLQENISFTRRPFLKLARRLRIKENELLCRIKELKRNGYIRNFSCHLNHKKVKFKSTLVALRVPPRKINSLAKRISRIPEVTHCYLRRGTYNLWSVFIYRDNSLDKFLQWISQELGKENVLNLTTLRQFKLKTRIKL